MESKSNSIEMPPTPTKGDITTSAHSRESSSVDTMESKSTFDKRLALKVDLYVLVPMLFLNFLSLMGRTNIGAALIQGLPKELKLDAMKVFLTISISLVPLILLEIPSNLLMRFLERKFNFSYMRYLSAITILLGKLLAHSLVAFADLKRSCYSRPRL
jgi:tryptophan synthase alpha subunit